LLSDKIHILKTALNISLHLISLLLFLLMKTRKRKKPFCLLFILKYLVVLKKYSDLIAQKYAKK